MKNALLFLIPLLLPASAFAFDKAELTDAEITQLEDGQPIISVWKDKYSRMYRSRRGRRW